MDEADGRIEMEKRADLQFIRHEINNLLTAILGHTQLLLMRSALDERARERVEKIEELANRLSETAAQLKGN